MSSKKTIDLLKQIVQYVQVGNGFEKVLKNVSFLLPSAIFPHQKSALFSHSMDIIEALCNSLTNGIFFYGLFDQIEITGGDVGRCVAEFVVKPENLNNGGGLHGGFTATVVDSFTTYALLTKESPPGVTVDLHVR